MGKIPYCVRNDKTGRVSLRGGFCRSNPAHMERDPSLRPEWQHRSGVIAGRCLPKQPGSYGKRFLATLGMTNRFGVIVRRCLPKQSRSYGERFLATLGMTNRFGVIARRCLLKQPLSYGKRFLTAFGMTQQVGYHCEAMFAEAIPFVGGKIPRYARNDKTGRVSLRGGVCRSNPVRMGGKIPHCVRNDKKFGVIARRCLPEQSRSRRERFLAAFGMTKGSVSLRGGVCRSNPVREVKDSSLRSE